MEMYNDRNIKALIESGNAIEYCCDEAWFQATYPREYAEIQESDDKHVYIACKAIEEDAIYGTAHGPLQKEMYNELFEIAGISQEERKLINSPDRMTNLIHTFKMIIRIIGSKSPISFKHRFSGNDCGFDKREILNIGMKKLDKACKDYMDGMIDKNILGQLIEAFKEYARKSSMLGNYSCIPISFGSCKNVNGEKGTNLKLNDGTHVNDQFSVFVEWIDENKVNNTCDIVDIWKSVMLLDESWKLYKSAGKVLIDSFEAHSHKTRLSLFTEYLRLVNKAIDVRTNAIVTKLDNCARE